MPEGERGQTRERDLEDAILAAEVTPSDFRVFVTLLKMADRGTANFPARWQPKSLVVLAERCHISLAGVKRSVGHLQRHGWLERYRYLDGRGIGGRSHPTHYKLLIGRDCDCKPAQREPVSDRKPAQRDTGNRLRGSRVAAGQASVSGGRAVAGEVREGSRKAEYKGGPVPWDQDDVNDWLSQTDH